MQQDFNAADPVIHKQTPCLVPKGWIFPMPSPRATAPVQFQGMTAPMGSFPVTAQHSLLCLHPKGGRAAPQL